MLPTNIPPTQLQREEEAITRWFVRAPAGTTIEQVVDPDYWAHVAGRMLRTPNKGLFDTVRVVAEDGSFDLEVTVTAIDPRGLWAQVRPLRVHKHEGAKPAGPDKDGYGVELAGPHRWRIVDRNGEVVSHGHATEEDARQALARLKAAKRAA